MDLCTLGSNVLKRVQSPAAFTVQLKLVKVSVLVVYTCMWLISRQTILLLSISTAAKCGNRSEKEQTNIHGNILSLKSDK